MITVLSILLEKGTTAPERKKGEERKGGTIFVVYLTLIIIFPSLGMGSPILNA